MGFDECEFKRRLEESQHLWSGINCAGTTLYLTQLEELDGFVSPEVVYETHLRNLPELSKPKIGSIAAWKTSIQLLWVRRHILFPIWQ